MKAITICQPFAHLIIAGDKDIENRPWPTRYRGPLLIHAGKSRGWLSDDDEEVYGVRHQDLLFGAILGIVELADCLPVIQLSRNEWAEGPYCLLLKNRRRLEKPIPYSGQQMLWEFPDRLLPAPPRPCRGWWRG